MGSLIGSTFRDTLAAQFNGIDEYMYVNDPTFKSDTAGAFAFWLRPTTVQTSNGIRGFIGYGTTSGANDSYFAIANRYNTTLGGFSRLEQRNRIVNGGNTLFHEGGSTLVAGSLYHIVIQSTGSTLTMYINGVAETISSYLNNFTTPGSNNGNWLGDVSGTNHRLTFGVDWRANAALNYSATKTNEGIYVGGRVLTGAEITALYNGGTPRNPHRITTLGSDLKSWWRFGDSRDDATTVYDEIGSNNLTLVNMDASNYVTP